MYQSATTALWASTPDKRDRETLPVTGGDPWPYLP